MIHSSIWRDNPIHIYTAAAFLYVYDIGIYIYYVYTYSFPLFHRKDGSARVNSIIDKPVIYHAGYNDE